MSGKASLERPGLIALAGSALLATVLLQPVRAGADDLAQRLVGTWSLKAGSDATLEAACKRESYMFMPGGKLVARNGGRTAEGTYVLTGDRLVIQMAEGPPGDGHITIAGDAMTFAKGDSSGAMTLNRCPAGAS
ncbi:MAG: hypothetical protein U1E53_05250 [Dongiaceae bacterium]